MYNSLYITIVIITVINELGVTSLIVFILFFFLFVKAFKMSAIFTYLMISYIMVVSKNILCLGIDTTTRV